MRAPAPSGQLLHFHDDRTMTAAASSRSPVTAAPGPAVADRACGRLGGVPHPACAARARASWDAPTVRPRRPMRAGWSSGRLSAPWLDAPGRSASDSAAQLALGQPPGHRRRCLHGCAPRPPRPVVDGVLDRLFALEAGTRLAVAIGHGIEGGGATFAGWKTCSLAPRVSLGRISSVVGHPDCRQAFDRRRCLDRPARARRATLSYCCAWRSLRWCGSLRDGR